MADASEVVDLPLVGIRVIDLADGKGEMCGRLLADLGADVLKIEPPGGGTARSSPPMVSGTSLYFATHNANKRSAELDLTTGAGRDRLLALAAEADILIETERPGRLAELGLGAADLHAINPQLIITSITDFGQTGPYRDWVATDFVHLALNTVLSRSGVPGERPLMPPGSLPTETAAAQAAWSTLVALWHRLDTGLGEHIDASVFETSIESMDPAFGMGGSAIGLKAASDLPRGRPDARRNYPIFACADGYVRICVLAERQWRNMFKALGEPAEFADPVWDALQYRMANSEILYPYYAALVRDRTRAECGELGRQYVVPIEGVLTPGEVLHQEHFQARGAWTPVELPDGSVGLMPNGFVEINGRRAGVRTPAPALGGPVEFTGPRPAFGAHPRRSPAHRPGPLSGIRVLDVGVIVVGAETGRLFADLGADVIKVESKTYLDSIRHGGTMNPTFAYGHRSKRSLGIDLRNPEGKHLFLELVAQADLVSSNFKPGTMDSLGLSMDVLRAANPAVVAIESSAMGSWGPASRNMGYGPLVRAATGLTSLWRYPEHPDGFCDSITIYPDHTVSRIGALSALAQLIGRRRHGHGGTVVGAQAEVILGQLAEHFLRESLVPGSFRALGNTGEYDAPYGVYQCRGDDEWCVVTIRGDDDWRRLGRAIDAPDLAADPSLDTAAGRVGQRDRIDAVVAAWTAERTPLEVANELQSQGVPAAMMLRPIEMAADPHLVSRRFFSTLPQPELGELLTETGPALFEHIAPPEPRRSPTFGEHTREIAREWLALADDEIAALVERGVLEEW